jgi:hypothetical protein
MEALVEALHSGNLVEADAVWRSHFSAVSEFYPLMAFGWLKLTMRCRQVQSFSIRELMFCDYLV